jgi:hypothetical protein
MNNLQPMWNANGYNVSGINENNQMDSYSSYNSKHRVAQFQNGRVIGLSGTKNNSNFQLMEVNNNKDDDAKKTILYGTQVRTPLSDAFFSNSNMNRLQEQLIHGVYVSSGGKYKIGKQSNTELQVIMRAMYLQYAKNLSYDIAKQVNELNRYVVEFCLPKVISEIKQYLFYINDIQRLPAQIPHPVNVSSAGTRTLKSVTTTF